MTCRKFNPFYLQDGAFIGPWADCGEDFFLLRLRSKSGSLRSARESRRGGLPRLEGAGVMSRLDFLESARAIINFVRAIAAFTRIVRSCASNNVSEVRVLLVLFVQLP